MGRPATVGGGRLPRPLQPQAARHDGSGVPAGEGVKNVVQFEKKNSQGPSNSELCH